MLVEELRLILILWRNMEQTKWCSFLESSLNMFSGFIVSLLVWIYFIEPVWEIEMSLLDNMKVSVVFTVAAIVRGYLWRRYFNTRVFGRQINDDTK